MASTTLSTLSSLNHILPFLQGPAQCQRWHISLSVSGQPQQFSPFSELFQVLNLIPYRLVLHCSFKCSCGSLHQLDLVLCFRSLTVAVQLPQLCCHTHPFQFASLPVVFFFCLFQMPLVPRPAQTRVAPAQGGNGVSPLRKIRDRDKRWG